MRIGLIGWYGHANYGDERILYCIKRFFSNYEFYITSGWEDAKLKINELNKCDYILIGGGGLILRDIGKQTSLINNFKKPFGFLGVSIEAKDKSMEEFLETIKEKAEFILVRDSQSKKYLDNHYKVIVGPDLTFLYPLDIANEVKEDICGLNLRDWYYWKGTLYGNYHNLMKKINSKSPFIETIYPFKKWDPSKTVDILKGKFDCIIPLPFYFETDTVNDAELMSRYFKNVPVTFNTSSFYNIRYLIGMRYHSIVFAAQCGIPFISLSYQPKNDTFCSDLGMDVLNLDIYNIKEIEEKMEYIKNHHNEIRNYLITFRQKYNNDINYICKSISNLIKDTI